MISQLININLTNNQIQLNFLKPAKSQSTGKFLAKNNNLDYKIKSSYINSNLFPIINSNNS